MLHNNSWLSPAKLNLFLHVVKKRSDGFHDLVSLFQAINLYDVLTFSFAEQDKITTDHPTLATDSSNLVFQAIRLFRENVPYMEGVHVHIKKNIPLQAGLGGGSSNVATTLWALNELCRLPCSTQQLQSMAALLSADAPFFFLLVLLSVEEKETGSLLFLCPVLFMHI
jgi:4-diphosphocytidyl-2-C-methyl-D-erythritol kinase